MVKGHSTYILHARRRQAYHRHKSLRAPSEDTEARHPPAPERGTPRPSNQQQKEHRTGIFEMRHSLLIASLLQRYFRTVRIASVYILRISSDSTIQFYPA